MAAELTTGAISVDHARLVTTALDDLASVDTGLAAGTEAPLLDAARRLDPTRLRREIAHARHALVPEAAGAADELAHHRRRIEVASTFEGTVAISGVLDPEGGEVLLTALAALSSRCGPEDHRSAGQRRADALVELCHRQLDMASSRHSAASAPTSPSSSRSAPSPPLRSHHGRALTAPPRASRSTTATQHHDPDPATPADRRARPARGARTGWRRPARALNRIATTDAGRSNPMPTTGTGAPTA